MEYLSYLATALVLSAVYYISKPKLRGQYLILVLATLALTACGDPLCIKDKVVDTLATKDGCTLYRYHNQCQREVYFTNCSGSTHTTHDERTGRTSRTVDDDVSGGR